MKKLLIISLFLLNGCTSKSLDQYQETSSTEPETSLSEVKPQSFVLNEEAIIPNDEGFKGYSIKIIKATTNLSKTSDSYTDGVPENTIEVTYEYKNYSIPENILVSNQFINAYDSNGVAGKNIHMMDGQTKISEEKSAQSTIWFVMNESMHNKDEVTLEYTSDFSLGFSGSVEFIVPLEH